ncbi:cytochrome c biogenesis CcdA family protein [Lysinimonas soli]|uniref:Cytochrome c biogenesis CcdA family protein n=1 Tax=Lysinimonas soli TaxID=1074233 RepID=A0ABW0NTU4_9MICO
MIQYALLVGMLASLNPCGAPLLPAYLGLFSMSGDDEPTIHRVHRGVQAGSTMSLGFLAVFVAVGLPLSAMAAAISAIGPGAIGVLGIAVIAVAVLGLRGRALPLPGRWLRFRGGRGTVAMFTFGALYALGSLGCELPLFLAATGVASTRDAVTAVAATIAYGVGMGLMVTTLSVIVALVGRSRRLRLPTLWVRRAGAAVALASGIYLLIFAAAKIWMPSLAATLNAPIVQGEAGVQQAMSLSPLWWATAFAAVIVAVAGVTAAAAAIRDRGRRHV